MKRRMPTLLLLLGWLTLMLGGVPVTAAADKPLEVGLTATNQKFEPAEIKVKAGEPFVLVVTNKDSKRAVEIENKDLRVEKVVPAGKTVNVRVRALKPGTYVFVDDFNTSAQVKIVAE